MIYALQGNGIDRAETAGCNGRGWREDVCYTHDTIDRPAVCYPEVFHTLAARNAGNVESAQRANCVCLATSHGGAEVTLDMAPTLMCGHDHAIVATRGKPPRKYIIRCLTPLERCRLQGFPDGWGIPDYKDRLTDEEAAFWQRVRDTCAVITGKPQKKYSAEALTRWYNGLHTDSAEYKMWGNGIALPCAQYVMEGVEDELRKQTEEEMAVTPWNEKGGTKK